MTKKVKTKLDQVNIPELFFTRFIDDIPQGTMSIADRIRNTPPKARGRGMTRVIKDLTTQEWEDLYQIAAKGRAAMKNADRDTTLFPAICAKSLADRMEQLGVDNPVAYTPKKTSRRTKAQIEIDNAAAESTPVESPAQPQVPVDPPKLSKVDIPESTPSEQEAFQKDINLG